MICRALTISIILLISAICSYGQSVRLPSGDSITYDFSGATRKGSPGLYKYFTMNTADDARITRNVADFNRDSLGGKGWRGMINFHGVYKLDSIRFYDRSGSVDTFWIFTFKDAPKWDTIINPEDYTPDYIIQSCGSCSGLPVTTKINANANDTVRFALVVMRRTNLFSGLWPDVSNISFFGQYLNQGDTTYDLAHWAVQQWTAKPIGRVVGHENLQNQQDTLWSDSTWVPEDTSKKRTFDQMFFDNENQPHGSQRISMGGGSSPFDYNQALARNNNFQITAVFGNSAYFNAQLTAAGHAVDKGWGTNTITDDPQLPASYSRKGYYMHALAWIGGNCAECPGVRTYNGTATPGRGYLTAIETTNEATLFAFANAWKTPIEVAAEAIGVYDSTKIGDPSLDVYVGAYEAYNYDDAKATIMLMKLHARSRNIKADGLTFHAIHTLKTDLYNVIPTTAQQVGNYGVSPGYNDDWRKNIHFQNGILRETGNPNFKLALTEDTYQKGYYKQYPTSEGETFSISQLSAPGYTVAGVAQDRLYSQAVGATQLEFIATASGLEFHVWYSAVDEVLLTVNPDYDAIDGNNGKFRKSTHFTLPPTAHPSFYTTYSRKRRLGNYVFVDSVHSEYRGLHVFKYRHVSADSAMYEFAVLDSTGTDTYELTGLGGSSGRLITPSFTSRQATQSIVTITGGSYTLNADPLPRALIVYEEVGGNQAPTAAAASDQSITLPTSQVTVNGSSSSDPDGTISTYLWTKTSGPVTYTITSPNSASTTITGLIVGTYVFTLTVTDDDGATDTDTITITVSAAPIVPTPARGLRLNRKFKHPS